MYVKLCYFLDSVSSQWNQQQYNYVNFKKSRSQCASLTEKVLHKNDIIKLNDSQVWFCLIIDKIEETHKSPGQVIIMIITNRWSDHIQENNNQVKSRFGTYQL